MAETTPPRSGPLAGASGRELRELQQFLLYLGSALTAAGEAVNRVEEHLRRVAATYGAPHARVSVLPTYLVLALEPGRPATLEPTRQLRGVLRLDQTAALFEVLKAAERGEPSPDEGSRRIQQIMDMRPRFGASVTVLGHVVLTVGICLVLQPTWGDLVLAALFGALVAVFKRVGGRWTSVQMIMPVAAAFAVAAITLPGGSLGWLLLVLYAAWIGQYVGGLALGGYLSGFVGAIVMTPVAYLVQRRPSGPPALVSFLPAFWLLVPGALGLIGVAEYLGQDPWRGSRTSSPPSAPWWPSALASSAAIRSTARWHEHVAGFKNSDPAEAGPDRASVPFGRGQERGGAARHRAHSPA